MRKLATIQTIKNIEPIENADAIELITINDWKVVAAKNVGHKIGDNVIYCEIDSFLPVREEFEFLRKSSYKKMGEAEGFRLKTIKMRGQLSQGLVLPISILGDFTWTATVGSDVSELLGIVKYEPVVHASLAGIAKGPFPSFIPKTDESRIQNLSDAYEEWKTSNHEFYCTEKLDGSSTTYFLKDGEFGVASRNLELVDPDTLEFAMKPQKPNAYWLVAKKYGIKEKLQKFGRNIALQGELIGEGIQGNPYNITGRTISFYNAYDIDNKQYYNLNDFCSLLDSIGLGGMTVPVLDDNYKLPDTIQQLLSNAEGKSVLNSNTEREGFVIRSKQRDISFKVISNKFLLNH